MEKVAVINLGTTKIDLIMANVMPEGNFIVFDEMSETVKIGQDMEQDGFIKSARIAEAISVLKMFKVMCDVNKITNVIAVAKSSIFVIPASIKSPYSSMYSFASFRVLRISSSGILLIG